MPTNQRLVKACFKPYVQRSFFCLDLAAKHRLNLDALINITLFDIHTVLHVKSQECN